MSVVYKGRGQQPEHGKIILRDFFVLYDDDNKRREIPLGRLREMIIDVVPGEQIGRIIADLTSWSGAKLRLGYYTLIDGKWHVNSDDANYVLLDTGFDIVSYEMFTWNHRGGPTPPSRHEYLARIGFTKLVITERPE